MEYGLKMTWRKSRAINGFMNFSIDGEELRIGLISCTGEKLFTANILLQFGGVWGESKVPSKTIFH